MLSTPWAAITPSTVLIRGIADEQRTPSGRNAKSPWTVVDHDNAFASFRQRMNHVIPDIAGAAGDKHSHELTHLQLAKAMLSAGAVKSGYQRTKLATMLNVAYRECANGA